MAGFQIPTGIYGLNRSLSTKRIQRDLNSMTLPVEEILVEPGMVTIVKKFPYRSRHLRVRIQVGQYYPFHPPVLRTEYRYPHYEYFARKISPLADLAPTILSYVDYEGTMSLKQFLYEDNGRHPDIVSRCDKCLSPWSPCFTLQLLSEHLAPIIRTASHNPTE